MVWLLSLGLGVVVALWLRATEMSVALASLPRPLLGVVALLAISRFYRRIRPCRPLAALARSGAELIAYTAVAAMLSQLAVTLNQPLIDDRLVAADRALGLDWTAMYRWIAEHPPLRGVLSIAYASVIPQMVLLQIVLHWGDRIERGRQLTWAFIATSLGCILLSCPFPAIGAFGTFHTEMDRPYVQQFLALRDGSLTAIDLGHAEGVVQCPSLHMALALVFIHAARGVRVLFPCVVALNLVVIAAIPAVGGHHFADLWAGAALTVPVLVAVSRAGSPIADKHPVTSPA